MATYAIIYGDSQATVSEAVTEAQLALDNAMRVGYEPISVGGGLGSAAASPKTVQAATQPVPGVIAGSLIACYVLLQGPDGAPRILPNTGLPVDDPS